MNCGEWEELVGLCVEGTLDPVQTRALDAHIGACAACREFAAGLAETQIALADLRQVSPDPEEYAQLRHGVMGRIATARRRVVWLPYAVAAGLLLALFAGYRPDHRPTSFHEIRPPEVRVHKSVDTAGRSARATFRVKRATRRATIKPERAEPLVIKMATPDPDVLIIWFVDKKGD